MSDSTRVRVVASVNSFAVLAHDAWFIGANRPVAAALIQRVDADALKPGDLTVMMPGVEVFYRVDWDGMAASAPHDLHAGLFAAWFHWSGSVFARNFARLMLTSTVGVVNGGGDTLSVYGGILRLTDEDAYYDAVPTVVHAHAPWRVWRS